MKRGNYMVGAMAASLAAGPAFLASLALTAWASEVPTTFVLGAKNDLVGGGLMLVIAATFFGFVISAVPNIIGAWFMHGLGIGNIAARLPIAWALAGAGVAGLPFAFVADFAGSLPLGTTFAFTGASCALVAHRFSTWTDPARLPLRRSVDPA